MLFRSRDNSRTPMQWNGSRNGGFTTAEVPWIAVNPNYGTINAEEQVKDPGSVYEYFRRLIALRASTPALIYGDYQDLDPENPKVFAYTRSLGADKYLVVMNFSREAVDYALPATLKIGELILSSDNRRESGKATVPMAGWEARIYRVR